MRDKVARGLLGAKTGAGFFVWEPGDRDRFAARLAAHVARRVEGLSVKAPSDRLLEFGPDLDANELAIARRLRAALWREALALLSAGVCDARTVDLMATHTFGLRLCEMGPLRNADFVGLDLALAVHERIFPTFDPSVEPPQILSTTQRFIA